MAFMLGARALIASIKRSLKPEYLIFEFMLRILERKAERLAKWPWANYFSRFRRISKKCRKCMTCGKASETLSRLRENSRESSYAGKCRANATDHRFPVP
jgi:hypothetical protein